MRDKRCIFQRDPERRIFVFSKTGHLENFGSGPQRKRFRKFGRVSVVERRPPPQKKSVVDFLGSFKYKPGRYRVQSRGSNKPSLPGSRIYGRFDRDEHSLDATSTIGWILLPRVLPLAFALLSFPLLFNSSTSMLQQCSYTVLTGLYREIDKKGRGEANYDIASHFRDRYGRIKQITVPCAVCTTLIRI